MNVVYLYSGGRLDISIFSQRSGEDLMARELNARAFGSTSAIPKVTTAASEILKVIMAASEIPKVTTAAHAVQTASASVIANDTVEFTSAMSAIRLSTLDMSLLNASFVVHRSVLATSASSEVIPAIPWIK